MKILKGVLMLVMVWGWRMIYSAPASLLEDFDSQVEQLLSSIMLTPQQIHNITTSSFDDLENKLRTLWGGAELFIYGSVLTGLGTKDSDVDLYARLSNYNATADAYIVIETAKKMNENPEIYGDIQQRLSNAIPMMTYYDIPKQRFVDLSFRSDSGVQNTELISYLLQLDKRHVPLAAIIKLWCKLHQLTGKESMPNYAEYVLVIFYLQQKKMAPSVSALQAHLPPLIVNEWDTNFKEIPYSVQNNETLYELLGGFFKYYSEFNFKDYCVSPYAGRPIARKDFENTDTVPEEFSFYKTNVRGGDYQPLPLEADLCIQDVFEHNANVGHRAKKDSVLQFINHLKHAAKMYDELPSDKFLKAILAKDEDEKKTEPEGNDQNTNLLLQDGDEH